MDLLLQGADAMQAVGAAIAVLEVRRRSYCRNVAHNLGRFIRLSGTIRILRVPMQAMAQI
jgi:hypothetical protein